MAKVLHTDTLLHTLRQMRQRGCVLALVVDGGDRPVGLVTEEELVRAWAQGPLVEVGEVMCPDEALRPGPPAPGARNLLMRSVLMRSVLMRVERPRGRLARRGRT